jgi:biotin-dependent carboxylase-like uncharacterized protein
MSAGAGPTARLTLLRSGTSTLVVDYGRPHSRSLGVPLGGAADRFSLGIGNALVGNAPDAAALEITLTGPVLRADADLACVLFGAPFEMHTGRRVLRPGTTFTLQAGEELHIGSTPRGARAYLCVRGGLHTALVLGSRSSLAPLGAGAELPCLTGRIRGRTLRVAFDAAATPLRMLDGPQAEWFRRNELLAPTRFVVTAAANRMGLRLDGPPLAVPRREMVSEPVCPGSVQVTHEGQCIVLGVDGQTIGGYPKVAQVIAADLDRLGQLRPGDELVFARVSLEHAEELYRQRQKFLREWTNRLRTAETLLP